MSVDPNIARSIMISVGKLDTVENFSDFTVLVEGREFRCHRFLLNACSGFFNALFRSGMKEATESSATVHGISSEIFSTVLKCLYKAENVITRDNVIEVWHAANLLLINFLIVECEKYVIEKLIPEDKQEVYTHAKLLDSGAVLRSIINLIAKDFEKFYNTSIFVQLYPEDIQALVQQEELVVSSEDIVVNAILKWVSHPEIPEDTDNNLAIKNTGGESCLAEYFKPEKSYDPLKSIATPVQSSGSTEVLFITENNQTIDKPNTSTKEIISTCTVQTCHRQEYLGRLLSSCRLCLVSTECLEMLLNSDFVLDNKDALLAVRTAVLFHFKPGPWSSMAIHRPTSPMENVVLFVEKKYLKAYSFLKDKTYHVSELPEPGNGSAMLSVINNQIFLLAQNLKGHFYSSLISLFVLTSPNAWTQVLENTIFQQNFALLNNFVYWITDSKICRIDVTLMMCNESIPAEIVMPLSVECSFIVKHTLAFNKKIIFLYSEDQQASFSAICLDTQNLKVSRHVLDGLGGHVVSFQDESHTFLLSLDGTLREMVDRPDGGVAFHFLTKLWGFVWDVRGAVVFEKQLYLFGNLNKTVEMLNVPTTPGHALCNPENAGKIVKWPWSTSLPGYFNKINVIFIDGKSQFLPFVISKKWMHEKPLMD